MKRKILLTGLFSIVGIAAFAQTHSTPNTLPSDLIIVYLQATFIGLLFSLIMLGIVSSIKYDLIDNRIRSQKDVRKRRITFFTVMLLLPAVWFYYLFFISLDQLAGTIGTYFVDTMQHAYILQELIGAYCVIGPFIAMLTYLLFFVLFSWIIARYFNKYKARTVIYSNHKIFGKISLNKKK